VHGVFQTIDFGSGTSLDDAVAAQCEAHRAWVVPVPPSVLEELRHHLSANVEIKPDARIFITPSGTPVRPTNWRQKIWQPAAIRTGIAGWATPYSLGRTAASPLAQRAVPVTTAAPILGRDPAIYSAPSHIPPKDQGR
jgi:hypothetical protein